MKKFYYFVFVLVMSACSVTTEESTTSSGSSDGTASSPMELTVGTAKSGGIASYGYSYYKFTTSSTGAGNYKLAINSLVMTESSSSISVNTYLYSNSGYSGTGYLDSEYCAASCTLYFDYENLDASKTYYLKLSGFGTVTYSLTVSQGGSEGSKNNPVELTLSSAHSGTIDNIYYSFNYGNSYYKFTTSSADNYTLTMNNSDSLDCSLYSDSAFSTYVTSYSYGHCTASENLSKTFTGTTSTVGLSASTAYYLIIFGTRTSAKTTTYNITVAPEG